MSQKLQSISLTPEGTGTLTVALDTLKLPHLLWSNSARHQKKLFGEFPTVANNTEHYIVTGYYISSERESHIQVDRSLQFSRMAQEILVPKGYRLINVFGASAGFTFDTSGQGDGMHVVGPPPKVAITKFFHHLCHDVLSEV